LNSSRDPENPCAFRRIALRMPINSKPVAGQWSVIFRGIEVRMVQRIATIATDRVAVTWNLIGTRESV
jgi:hypothetical protein